MPDGLPLLWIMRLSQLIGGIDSAASSKNPSGGRASNYRLEDVRQNSLGVESCLPLGACSCVGVQSSIELGVWRSLQKEAR